MDARLPAIRPGSERTALEYAELLSTADFRQESVTGLALGTGLVVAVPA